MSDAPADPRCPECGEPIGQRATYCMHCSADLTEERSAADGDGDGAWDGGDATASGTPPVETGSASPAPESTGTGSADGQTIDDESVYFEESAGDGGGQLLDPDGIMDNTLTVLVGIAGGFLTGVVGTFVVLAITGSGWGLLVGIVAWLGATAWLVRRRTVQGAVAGSGYAIAVVLLLVPLTAFSPAVSVDGGLADRVGTFVGIFILVAIPAAVAVGIGLVASRYVPEDADSSAR